MSNKEMKYDALIIIDMQTALLADRPYQANVVIANINRIYDACQKLNIPVIHVRHDGGEGDELQRGCPGWEIDGAMHRDEKDKIIDKSYNSCFRKTQLDDYLQSIHVKHLIMCGMQSEYCFDVSCKVAYEKEYIVTIPKDSTTTFDNAFASGETLSKYYEEKIWNNRYASVVSVEEILASM